MNNYQQKVVKFLNQPQYLMNNHLQKKKKSNGKFLGIILRRHMEKAIKYMLIQLVKLA